MKYITFDGFYDIKTINQFVEMYQFNNSSLLHQTYISLRQPYKWYFKVPNEKLPEWLKYEEASNSTIKYLVHKIIPLNPSQEYKLTRRSQVESESISAIQKYIEPEIFEMLRKDKSYGVIFRYGSNSDLQNITKQLSSRIYVLGKHRNTWNFAFSFDKGIKSFISDDYIFLEKNKRSQYKNIGDFEYEFNLRLVNDKLKNKVIYYPYWDKGTYYPLTRPIPE